MSDATATAPPDARKLASNLRASLSTLKNDIATSFRLCGRDFGILGAELLSAVERGQQRERRSLDALVHERSARGLLETRLNELQGNIRVLCRVRPMPAVAAGSSGEESDVTSPDRHRKRVKVESAQELSVFSPVDGALYKSFSFSRVFHEQHSQLTVFKEVAPLVRSAVAGHHACIFAYGQTGAGKTYTMQGMDSEKGLYYRSIELIFSLVAQQQHVYDFQVLMQMVEIYNEEIYDLLALSRSTNNNGASTAGTSTTTATTVASSVSAASTSTVEIRHGENGVYLKNAESIVASGAEELYDAISRSKSNRTVAKSDHSNRSHTVLMIDIRRASKANGEADSGRLVLVDLAGSERLVKTAESSTLTVRESQHINKSLAAVGDVLSALRAKEKHVPFRNSKLTHLLQNSLSGSANRTLLIVHVSPKSTDVNETINTLNFAARFSHTQMGKSQRHERADIARLNGVVANQNSQILALQEKLTAERQLRKKYEKQLAEHRRRSKGNEARRMLEQMQSPSPPAVPPPVSARRWSLYTRKYADRRVKALDACRCLRKRVNSQGLNGIENIAENILRGNESSPETTEIGALSSGKPSGISPPTIFSRRLSLSGLDQKAGDPTKTQKRKRLLASEKVRSILKKRRGSKDELVVDEIKGDTSAMTSKQVSFNLAQAGIRTSSSTSSSFPSRELNTSTKSRPVRGAVRVLAVTRPHAAASLPSRVASTPGKRAKSKSIGWR